MQVLASSIGYFVLYYCFISLPFALLWAWLLRKSIIKIMSDPAEREWFTSLAAFIVTGIVAGLLWPLTIFAIRDYVKKHGW